MVPLFRLRWHGFVGCWSFPTNIFSTEGARDAWFGLCFSCFQSLLFVKWGVGAQYFLTGLWLGWFQLVISPFGNDMAPLSDNIVFRVVFCGLFFVGTCWFVVGLRVLVARIAHVTQTGKSIVQIRVLCGWVSRARSFDGDSW